LKFRFVEEDAAWPFVMAFRVDDEGFYVVHYNINCKSQAESLKKISSSPLAQAFIKSQIGMFAERVA